MAVAVSARRGTWQHGKSEITPSLAVQYCAHVDLVGRSPTSVKNGRSGCKPILKFVLARYVLHVPLNLGGCNISIMLHAYTLQRSVE